jgi:hypothetical protein
MPIRFPSSKDYVENISEKSLFHFYRSTILRRAINFPPKYLEARAEVQARDCAPYNDRPGIYKKMFEY